LTPDLPLSFVDSHHEVVEPEGVRRNLRDPTAIFLVGSDDIFKARRPHPADVRYSRSDLTECHLLEAKTAGVNSDKSIASASIAEVLKFVEVLEAAIHQDGTLEYPFIHIVKMEYPERNRGFDIVLVNNIEHQGYTRDGFHIRKAVAVMDSTRWEAVVPYKKIPTLAHCALMFVGPLQDYWHRNTTLYHEDNVNCKPTQKKHSTTRKRLRTTLFVNLSTP
jgi:hypothetical protein